MRFHAILFDLDGTLLNRNATFRHFLESQFSRFADLFPSPPRDLDRLMAIDDNARLPRADFYRQLEADQALPSGAASRLLADFRARFPETCVEMPNLFPTLDALRNAGLRLGLITNGDESIQGRKVDRLGLRPVMDTVVISGVVGVQKPDPRIFAEALSRLGVAADQAAFVGDHPEADVLGAKRSGLFAIWRRDALWPAPENADAVIDDLAELVPLVLGTLETF